MRLHTVSCLSAGIGVPAADFTSGTAWSAPPADWSAIPTKTVKLFYPGQSSFQ